MLGEYLHNYPTIRLVMYMYSPAGRCESLSWRILINVIPFNDLTGKTTNKVTVSGDVPIRQGNVETY